MAVEYGADVTNPAYTYSSLYLNRQSVVCAQGDTAYAYVNNAFNNVAAANSCSSLRANAAVFQTNGTAKIGQDFGSDNKKLIRKIRYQYFRRNNGVGTPEATISVYRSINSSTMTLVGTYDAVTNDTGWNELILPKTIHSQKWEIRFATAVPGYIYMGEVWNAMGEIEMMEGVDIANSVAFFL